MEVEKTLEEEGAMSTSKEEEVLPLRPTREGIAPLGEEETTEKILEGEAIEEEGDPRDDPAVVEGEEGSDIDPTETSRREK
jgi:hypothetical protein